MQTFVQEESESYNLLLHPKSGRNYEFIDTGVIALSRLPRMLPNPTHSCTSVDEIDNCFPYAKLMLIWLLLSPRSRLLF